MAAHRYWRLKWDSSPRGFCSCLQLQFRDTLGGPDLTQGSPGVAIDGSHYNGYTPNRAFARGSSDFWSSDGPADWLGWDFGSGAAFDIVQTVYEGRPGLCNDDAPRPGGLEWSDDGASWTRSFTLSPIPGSYNDGVFYAFPATPLAAQEASKMAAYVVEGSPENLLASKMAVYVVEGPPPIARRRSGPLIG